MIILNTAIAGRDKNGELFSYAPGDKVSLDRDTEKRLVESGQAKKTTVKRKS